MSTLKKVTILYEAILVAMGIAVLTLGIMAESNLLMIEGIIIVVVTVVLYGYIKSHSIAYNLSEEDRKFAQYCADYAQNHLHLPSNLTEEQLMGFFNKNHDELVVRYIVENKIDYFVCNNVQVAYKEGMNFYFNTLQNKKEQILVNTDFQKVIKDLMVKKQNFTIFLKTPVQGKFGTPKRFTNVFQAGNYNNQLEVRAEVDKIEFLNRQNEITIIYTRKYSDFPDSVSSFPLDEIEKIE